MRKVISSPKSKFRHLAHIALATNVACDAFTELLESLRAKNSDGKEADALSQSSTAEV